MADRARIAAYARWVGFDLYMRTLNALLRLPGHRLRRFVIRRLGRVSVGRGTAIERGVVLRTKGGVEIGPGCNINHGVVLDGRGGLRIGSLVNISPEAALLTAEHDPASPTFAGRNAPVIIGDRTWVAMRALVLPGTRLGEGAVVGAGAVVRGEVAPWTIVAGNPAKTVANRPSSAQQELEPYRRWFH